MTLRVSASSPTLGAELARGASFGPEERELKADCSPSLNVGGPNKLKYREEFLLFKTRREAGFARRVLIFRPEEGLGDEV